MNKKYNIIRLEQFKALTSPVRGEIIDLIELTGPMSVAEMAEHMGRPLDSLYYHVRRLLKVGLLVETDKRKTIRQWESVYDLPGRPISLDYVSSQAAHVREVIKTTGTILRMTERDVRAAFRKKLVSGSGVRRNVVHSRFIGWCTEEEVREIRKQISSIKERLHSNSRDRNEKSRLYALTTILVPLEIRGKGRNR